MLFWDSYGRFSINPFSFVKIILLKSDNCALALRKRLFCAAKPTLLPCKTAAFGMQNNRFRNALVMRLLHNSIVCEKYLQLCSLVFSHTIRIEGEVTQGGNLYKIKADSVSEVSLYALWCSLNQRSTATAIYK